MSDGASHAMPALSVRQPFAEQILRGLKRFEYRSQRTHKRGRVYLYASLGGVDDAEEWRKLGVETGAVCRGAVVGTVEIVGCDWCAQHRCYRWHMKAPRRLKPRRPRNHPQPVWFYPF